MGALLTLQSIQVSFSGFMALDLETFEVAEGELRVIIGPNGAGKTTLCDVISGKTKPSRGRVTFAGTDVTGRKEEDICVLGVGRKFQTPTVFESLTAFENMELALPGRRSVAHNFTGRPQGKDRERVLATLARCGLAEQAGLPAKYLSHGQRQWLEIAMLIIQDLRLLLVDEPAAGLSDPESLRTAALLKQLAGPHTLIVIEHDMDFVRALDSRVTVLNEGRILCEGSMREVEKDERVVEAYLGR